MIVAVLQEQLTEHDLIFTHLVLSILLALSLLKILSDYFYCKMCFHRTQFTAVINRELSSAHGHFMLFVH